MTEVKLDKKGRLVLLYCLSDVLGSVCCHSGKRVWSCNKYSGERCWEKRSFTKKTEGLQWLKKSGQLRMSRCQLKDKLMLKGIIN